MNAAAAGDEPSRDLARRLSTSLDAAARLVILEALADAASEITVELAPGSVDLRMRGRDPELVVTRPPAEDSTETGPTSAAAPADTPRSREEDAHGSEPPDEGPTTRTTLRMPEELRARVEDAAASAGVSINTWLVRAVTRSLAPEPSPRRGRPSEGSRITGWVR